MNLVGVNVLFVRGKDKQTTREDQSPNGQFRIRVSLRLLVKCVCMVDCYGVAVEEPCVCVVCTPRCVRVILAQGSC